MVCGLHFLKSLKSYEPWICCFADAPANIVQYLPETFLAKSQQSSTAVLTKVSLVAEPPGLPGRKRSSPNVVCPRPLKHRRITPTALPSSPSSVQKHRIVPAAICVPAANFQKPPRITPIPLTEDNPLSSGICLDTFSGSGVADTPSSMQATDQAEYPCSSLKTNSITSQNLEVFSSGPAKRLYNTRAPLPVDTPLSSFKGPVHVENNPTPF